MIRALMVGSAIAPLEVVTNAFVQLELAVLNRNGEIEKAVIGKIEPEWQSCTPGYAIEREVLDAVGQESAVVDQELGGILCAGRNYQVLEAIIVVIRERPAVRIRSRCYLPGVNLERAIFESPVAEVDVQAGLIAMMAYEKVREGVVVGVAPGRTVGLSGVFDTGVVGDVLKLDLSVYRCGQRNDSG
jgi:hypothetical protein